MVRGGAKKSLWGTERGCEVTCLGWFFLGVEFRMLGGPGGWGPGSLVAPGSSADPGLHLTAWPFRPVGHTSPDKGRGRETYEVSTLEH